jgi:large subunit ribosomal protein L10
MVRINIQKKIDFEKKLVPLFEQAKSMVVTENKGLTVDQVNALRHSFRQAGVTFKVIKNTMSRRIANSLKIEGITDYFVGPTAIAFHPQDEAAPIKVIVEFQKKNKDAKIEVKAGWIGKNIFNPGQLAALAKLPSKEILLSQLCSVLQAPMANVAAVLNAILSQVPATIQAVAEQKKNEETKTNP